MQLVSTALGHEQEEASPEVGWLVNLDLRSLQQRHSASHMGITKNPAPTQLRGFGLQQDQPGAHMMAQHIVGSNTTHASLSTREM